MCWFCFPTPYGLNTPDHYSPAFLSSLSRDTPHWRDFQEGLLALGWDSSAARLTLAPEIPPLGSPPKQPGPFPQRPQPQSSCYRSQPANPECYNGCPPLKPLAAFLGMPWERTGPGGGGAGWDRDASRGGVGRKNRKGRGHQEKGWKESPRAAQLLGGRGR